MATSDSAWLVIRRDIAWGESWAFLEDSQPKVTADKQQVVRVYEITPALTRALRAFEVEGAEVDFMKLIDSICKDITNPSSRDS